jgi:hypothetical protein
MGRRRPLPHIAVQHRMTPSPIRKGDIRVKIVVRLVAPSSTAPRFLRDRATSPIRDTATSGLGRPLIVDVFALIGAPERTRTPNLLIRSYEGNVSRRIRQLPGLFSIKMRQLIGAGTPKKAVARGRVLLFIVHSEEMLAMLLFGVPDAGGRGDCGLLIVAVTANPT